MSLCRHYVRELRRSMLIDTPDMNKATSKRSSQLLDNFNLDDVSSHPSTNNEKGSQEQKISAILREDTSKPPSRGRDTNVPPDHSPANSLTSNISRPIRPSNDRLSYKEAPSTPNTGLDPPTRPSFMTSSRLDSDSHSPGHTVARPDLRASAEKILYTYILPGSEREIILPPSIVNEIIKAIEEDGRDDPEIFDYAKDYVFQAMERDAFPGFLQAKALGNLVPLSILIRLIIGLLSLGGGFWAGYYCILRNISRSTRCWVCLLVPATTLSNRTLTSIFTGHSPLHDRSLLYRLVSIQT